ncbi:Rho GTPase-activating protein 8 [Mycena kentingensis (nom. inval.)]|nr:Rho GTPase-activating protein 8 [Mycena kentingensis (nom. inval.)]
MPPILKTGSTLKQRLAALSNAQSAPSSPGPLSPSALKRKFTLPWGKRPAEASAHPASENDKLDEVISRMIFQAGVDFETRPMVVINASALPDPKEYNYDALLTRILAYLNLYVESDYAVVLFAAGVRNTPGWNWVWKAYRSLNRKYRKHLKRLYLVHSSFFSKMLFSLAGAIISPKFFRKIVYIATLSELACHIPLTQIDIPPAVYQENLKFESKITMPVTTLGDTHIFGVPLADLMGIDGEKGGLPRVVKDAIQFIRESGMQEEGLFRRSPQSAMLRAAQDAYDRGNVVSLDTFGDPHLAAVLLKKYLRDLPDPVIPEHLYPLIRACPSPSSSPDTTNPVNVERDLAAIAYIRETILPQLPLCVYILLSHVLHLMHDVSLRAASNRMDAHNLAVVLCPNLVKGKNPARDVFMCAVSGGPALFPSSASSASFRTSPSLPSTTSPTSAEGKTTLGSVIKLCIQRYFEVFDELSDRTEAVSSPPLGAGSAAGSSSASSASSTSGFPRPRPRPIPASTDSSDPRRQSARSQNEDEEIDDEMLVMPLGPTSVTPPTANGNGHAPPSAWGLANANGNGSGNGNGTYRVRNARSVVSASGASTGGVYGVSAASAGRTRSLVSVEKGAGPVTPGTVGRKGSIAIGRAGTLRDGRGTVKSGAAVEALGITAEGFFSAPANARRLLLPYHHHLRWCWACSSLYAGHDDAKTRRHRRRRLEAQNCARRRFTSSSMATVASSSSLAQRVTLADCRCSPALGSQWTAAADLDGVSNAVAILDDTRCFVRRASVLAWQLLAFFLSLLHVPRYNLHRIYTRVRQATLLAQHPVYSSRWTAIVRLGRPVAETTSRICVAGKMCRRKMRTLPLGILVAPHGYVGRSHPPQKNLGSGGALSLASAARCSLTLPRQVSRRDRPASMNCDCATQTVGGESMWREGVLRDRRALPAGTLSGFPRVRWPVAVIG